MRNKKFAASNPESLQEATGFQHCTPGTLLMNTLKFNNGSFRADLPAIKFIRFSFGIMGYNRALTSQMYAQEGTLGSRHLTKMSQAMRLVNAEKFPM